MFIITWLEQKCCINKSLTIKNFVPVLVFSKNSHFKKYLTQFSMSNNSTLGVSHEMQGKKAHCYSTTCASNKPWHVELIQRFEWDIVFLSGSAWYWLSGEEQIVDDINDVFDWNSFRTFDRTWMSSIQGSSSKGSFGMVITVIRTKGETNPHRWLAIFAIMVQFNDLILVDLYLNWS